MEEAPKTIINVAGDYVQSKHVDYEINNVEAGGIGIQFLTKEQRTFPTPYTVHPKPSTEHSQNTTTRFGCCVPVGMIYTPAGRRTSLVEVRY